MATHRGFWVPGKLGSHRGHGCRWQGKVCELLELLGVHAFDCVSVPSLERLFHVCSVRSHEGFELLKGGREKAHFTSLRRNQLLDAF